MIKPNKDVFNLLRAKVKWAYGHDLEPLVVEALEFYLKHCPQDGYMWGMYGDALAVLGRFDEAVRALHKAVELAPATKLYLMFARLAFVHSEAGRHEEAERWFAKSIDGTEGVVPSWIWLFRGKNLARLGRFDDAIACHRNSLVVESKDEIDESEVYLNIGLALRAQRKYDAAAESFRKAISLKGENSRKARVALASLRNLDNLPKWIGESK